MQFGMAEEMERLIRIFAATRGRQHSLSFLRLRQPEALHFSEAAGSRGGGRAIPKTRDAQRGVGICTPSVIVIEKRESEK